MNACADDCVVLAGWSDIDNVLAAQCGPEVAEFGRNVIFVSSNLIVLAGQGVDGEDFIVAESVEIGVGEEASVVD